ncbi:MAG: hypothetical protein ATN34_04315 [Epulopiscium sp. Nele67-Bin002]|nr:MAG: hypothetical protein ATN34_04315 [Epulopiscium sp. Nele67-Bin002]OON91252.1 MAG: hypothetical protein ATN33_01540 [Epulopiscium sp. Nele67-Bin001]
MPEIMTHYFFGLDSLNAIKPLSVYKVIKNYRSLYYMGLCGPDPMYYHRLLNKENYNYVATIMHNQNTAKFIGALFEYYNMLDPKCEDAQAVIAYISGFICHFVLDTTAHPYVFYIGGKYDKSLAHTVKYKGLHQHIELSIDSLLLQKHYGIIPKNFKVHKHILKVDSIPQTILNMYKFALFKTYQIEHGDIIIGESFTDYKIYYRMTHDSFGIKRQIGVSLKPILPQGLHQFTGTFSYYDCVKYGVDYLNEKKAVWLHPVNGIVNTYSFEDLLKNALKKSSLLLRFVDNYLNDYITLEELLSHIPNLSYSTGLPLDEQQEMIYFSDELAEKFFW